jgi:hypothetical protein
MIPGMGNCQHDTSRVIHSLHPGKLYHWATQTVGPMWNASPFSASHYFSVYHQTFQELYQNLPNLTNAAVALGDFGGDKCLDIAIAGRSETQGFAAIYNGNGHSNPTSVVITLPAVTDPGVSWGDFDNDGDLDLALAGATPGSGSLTRIYRRSGINIFTDINAGLAGTHDGSLAWGDYDNDGDLDLLITGNWTTKLYRNDRGTFVDANAGFVGLLKSSAEWGDYDRDGDLDLVVTGQSQSAGAAVLNTRIYRNDNGIFTDIGAGLVGVRSGTAAWCDFDNDGDLDLLVTGDIGSVSPNVPFTALYRNTGGAFSTITVPFDSLHHSHAVWGDVNNDGREDLVLTGDRKWWGEGDPVTRIYRNTGTGFDTLSHPCIAISGGMAALGNYFNGARLDLLLAGSGWTKFYRNNMAPDNTPPQVPGGLQVVSHDSVVVLRWSRSSDNETPRAALTYNIRIGTTRGGSQIMSAMSDSNGVRLIPARGNAGTDTVHTIKKLVPGKRYYWTVQAIDNGLLASQFAPEQSFIFGLSVSNNRRFGLLKPIADFQWTADTLVMNLASLGKPETHQTTKSNWVIKGVRVAIDSVYHTSDGDLEFTLSHGGVTDTLMDHVGGTGDNFLGTVLDDSADNPIASGTAPFGGTYRPSALLARFNGMDPDGSWILSIYDAVTGNTGTLNGWGLELTFDKATDVDGESGLPTQFVLYPNYPNPFNPATHIRFGLPQAEQVTVTIFNLLGQQVCDLVKERLEAGYHSIAFDARNLASGVYVYRVHAGENVGTRKMVLVK